VKKKTADPELKGRILARVHAEQLAEVTGGKCIRTPGGQGFPDDEIIQDPTWKLQDDSY
jgi:hypothetical protein